MIKYFEYEQSSRVIGCPYIHQVENKINDYAKKNNLEIVSACCDRDKGIFVIFKGKS